MIEMVYRKENAKNELYEGNIKLPKNIKQIGDGQADIQVYMEDNVSLYLGKVPDHDDDIRYGVLLGNVKYGKDYTYIFITGAVDVREVFDNTVLFSEDIWTGLNEDISRYFKGQKVVGWFLSQPLSNTSQNMWIKKMHINNFAGMDKVFYRVDRDEGEDGFYYFGKEHMEKLGCYHIYFEKNQNMVDYMELSGGNMYLRKGKSPELRGGLIGKVKESEFVEENNPEEKAISIEKKFIKYNAIIPKVASAAVVAALMATLGYMGSTGKLNSLVSGAKDVLKNIVDDNDNNVNNSGIISVNALPYKEVDTTTMTKESGENSSNEEQTDESTDASSENTTENREGTETMTVNSDNTTAESNSRANDEETQTTKKEDDETEVATASIEPTYNEYIVVKGDTLYKICMKLYGNIDNMDKIVKINNLSSPDEITYGKKLLVP